MSETSVSNKDKREQRKAEQRAQQTANQKQQVQKKFIVVGFVVFGLVITFLVARSLMNNSTVPDQGAFADPVKGNSNAAVALVEYGDFECPACAQFTPLLDQAYEEFGDQISITFNDFPLTTIHPNAFTASEAAQCAHVQNKFWEYHDLLYQEQTSWSVENNPRDKFVEYAQQIQLNVEQFTACVDNGDAKLSVREDMKEGDQAGVNSTPTLYINGERYANTGTYAGLSLAIRQALTATTNEQTDANSSEETNTTN